MNSSRYWFPALGAGGLGAIMLLLAQRTPPGGAPMKNEAPRVPVMTLPARRGEIHVYIGGLGAVTPTSTVTVRTRVDGELMRVLFQEGQHVARGALLAEIDARPFEAQLLLAQGQMNRDLALLANARRDLDRYRVLSTQDSIARQQYDTQKSLVRQYEGTVKADQAQVDAAQIQVVYARITSPISGRVGLRLVDAGNIVHAADATGLAVITQLRPISVVFSIPEDNIPRLLSRIKQKERIEVDAFNRDFTQKLDTGALLTLDNEIDPTTGTVKVKAVFENDEDGLFPNQFVNARLLLDVLEGATVVPQAAIQRGPGKPFVYLVRPDDTVGARDVVLGPSEGDAIAIESGLAPGDVVVVEGADNLRDGSRVTARPSTDAGPSGTER